MRLAIIRQRYDPEGAAERFLEGALEALLERNVAITLYTRAWPATKLQLIEPAIVDPFHVGALWRDAGFARAVARSVAGAGANLVQSHELVLTCDVYRPDDGLHVTWLEQSLRDATLPARWRAALSPRQRYALAMERKLFASPWLRMVLCPSPLVRDEIEARFQFPHDRLRVLRNAVDTDRFQPALAAQRAPVRERHAIATDAPVFVLVGSGFRRKGARTALAALAKLQPPAHLIVVGSDPNVGEFERAARACGVGERVTFAGYQADVAPYLGAADAFVLPAPYDPSADATMEAMARGLPVVTSTRSGAADLVLAHDAGITCPADDADAFAAAMRTLLDASTRQAMGERARDAVLPYAPAATTLALVLVYKELLEASIAHRLAPKSATAAPAAPPAEAAPLHGEFGLDAETLVDPPPVDAAPDALPPDAAPPAGTPPH
ncbi:MAG: glycosyltransferase family 4 protein [Burkholderiales bacterium]|nr:glycosyltransferase family 4 protein [Burkholderiales bacterium]